MADDDILRRQLRFFIEKRAGCLFAAAAAQNPHKYGWVHRITPPQCESIDLAVAEAVDEPSTTTLSLLFPDITEIDQFLELIKTLKRCDRLMLGQVEKYGDAVCVGFRVTIGNAKSYVTGFGDFPFLPVTRRAPFVELTMRVKPRPSYDFVFKEAPPGIIHLADLDMQGMAFDNLQRLWDNSFVQTRNLLGATPDLRSAARTTYSIPRRLFNTIS